MPPPRTILCEICNGKFFKSSLAIHKKQCAKKHIAATTNCPVCGLQISNDEYQSHVPACKDANRDYAARTKGKKAGKGKVPSNSRLLQGTSRATEMALKVLAGEDTSPPPEPRLKGGELDFEAIAAQAAAQAPEEDYRVSCDVCGRKFNGDRIAKHQMICMKTSGKKRKQFKSAEQSRLEGTDFWEYRNCRSDAPWVSKWRKEHEVLQSAIPEEAKSDTKPSGAADGGGGGGGDAPAADAAETTTGEAVPPKKVKKKRMPTRRGDTVELADGRVGMILYQGPVHGLPKGWWLGVRFETAIGKNDGSYHSQPYFYCEPNHGSFVRPAKVVKVTPPEIPGESKEAEKVGKDKGADKSQQDASKGTDAATKEEKTAGGAAAKKPTPAAAPKGAVERAAAEVAGSGARAVRNLSRSGMAAPTSRNTAAAKTSAAAKPDTRTASTNSASAGSSARQPTSARRPEAASESPATKTGRPDSERRRKKTTSSVSGSRKPSMSKAGSDRALSSAGSTGSGNGLPPVRSGTPGASPANTSRRERAVHPAARANKATSDMERERREDIERTAEMLRQMANPSAAAAQGAGFRGGGSSSSSRSFSGSGGARLGSAPKPIRQLEDNVDRVARLMEQVPAANRELSGRRGIAKLGGVPSGNNTAASSDPRPPLSSRDRNTRAGSASGKPNTNKPNANKATSGTPSSNRGSKSTPNKKPGAASDREKRAAYFEKMFSQSKEES